MCFNKVDECRCNDMRQMTDRSGNLVMYPIIKDNRECFQAFCKFFIGLHLFMGNLVGRCQNKICIFNQHCFGITVSAFFRTGHRMSSDKVFSDTECLYFLMDVRFYTSYICKNAVIIQIFCQLFEISSIRCNRCA